MAYIGYHEKLPIKAGQEVVIPKGTLVRAYNRDNYVTKRAQKVTVHHTLPGQSINILMCLSQGDRARYPEHAETFARFDEIRKQYSESTDVEETRRLGEELRAMTIHTMNPEICWAGAGGYWRQVDINDVISDFT